MVVSEPVPVRVYVWQFVFRGLPGAYFIFSAHLFVLNSDVWDSNDLWWWNVSEQHVNACQMLFDEQGVLRCWAPSAVAAVAVVCSAVERGDVGFCSVARGRVFVAGSGVQVVLSDVF